MSAFFSQFHFLRPEVLFLLLLCPLIAWLFRQHHRSGNDWSRSIAPELLVHLTRDPATKGGRRRFSQPWLVALLSALAILALAGPAWQQKPQPVAQVKDDLVVILDLSISMLATDVQPNRLTRTKQKLQDLLSLRKEGNTALIVFSGDSHVVTPLTDDTHTISANLPALDPFMMPVIGSRPDLAVIQAVELLNQGQATQGRIMMLTDGIEPHQEEVIREALDDARVSLSILAAGTTLGGPIDLNERGYLKNQGSVVIPKTDLDRLQAIAETNGGAFSAMTLDDDDLIALDVDGSRRMRQLKDQQESGIEQGFDRWEDAGFWLLLLIIPGVLIAHRQGAFVLALICLLPFEELRAEQAPEQEQQINTPSFWSTLWQTPDQRGQALLREQHYDAAADAFESAEHKAYALYKAGDFEQASETFPVTPDQASSRVHYNRGNALAQQQQFKQAIEAYEQAITLDPDNDDARFNKKLIEEFLEQQQNQNQDSQEGQEGQEGKDGQKNDSQSDQQNSDSQNGDKQQSDSQPSGSSSDQSSTGQQNQQQDKANSEQSSDPQAQDGQEQDAGQDKASEQQAGQGEQEDKENAQSQTQEVSGDTDQEPQDESGQSSAVLDDLSQEERQSFEQWMRRVPDDPGGLLRRKFEQQARERNREQREEGEPLW